MSDSKYWLKISLLLLLFFVIPSLLLWKMAVEYQIDSPYAKYWGRVLVLYEFLLLLVFLSSYVDEHFTHILKLSLLLLLIYVGAKAIIGAYNGDLFFGKLYICITCFYGLFALYLWYFKTEKPAPHISFDSVRYPIPTHDLVLTTFKEQLAKPKIVKVEETCTHEPYKSAGYLFCNDCGCIIPENIKDDTN